MKNNRIRREPMATILRFSPMKDVGFKEVTLKTAQPGEFRQIRSVAEAHEFLTTEWQGLREGPAAARAKIACLAALDGNQMEKEARAAFVDAAIEADILVEQKFAGLLDEILK